MAAEGRDFHGLCLVRLVERKAPAMSISDNTTDSAYVWASKHEDYIHPSHCMFIDHVVTADEVQEWLEEVPALAPLERTRFGGEDDGVAFVPKGEQLRGARRHVLC